MRSLGICRKCLSRYPVGVGLVPQLESRILSSFAYYQTPVRRTQTRNLSASSQRLQSTPKDSRTNSGQKRILSQTSVTITGIVLLAAAWYGFSSSNKEAGLNKTSFTSCDIVSKEIISPTAFVLTVRFPKSDLIYNSPKLKAAWEHGLWSVEIKQPQLQIARNYTPLPPMSGDDAEDCELRFLIRKMDGGEMSNYLSRLQVGDKVWLRGPHYGFNISKRLGEAKQVVFLAGGTGVAPALQLAHKLLDGPNTETKSSKPTVRILWANRRSVDSVARETLPQKPRIFRLATDSTLPPGQTAESSFHRQIQELKIKHEDHFRIEYFVDDENKFIGLKDIDAAMGQPLASKTKPALVAASRDCRWHSPFSLPESSDEQDSAEGAVSQCSCSKGPSGNSDGRNIICVSGPDGFVTAYAGAKQWSEGRETQGPIRGYLGTLKQQSNGAMDDWLVLKM